MWQTLGTVAAAAAAGLLPLAVGVRRGQLTAGVVTGTFAAGAVVQFEYAVGGVVAAVCVAVLLLLPRRVVRRREGQ